MQQQQQQQQMQQMATQMAQPQFAFEGGHLVMFHPASTQNMPNDATVNDRDRMADLLNQEKYLSNEYNIAMNEASHQALYQVLKQCCDTVHQLERSAFNIMFKKGWYKLPVADVASVSATYNQFQKYRAQFPFPQQAQQQAQMGGTTGSQADQQVYQAVNTAIQNAKQGQVTGFNQASANTNTATQQAVTQQTGSKADQAVNQKVTQAIREAERGHTPSGFSRTH